VHLSGLQANLDGRPQHHRQIHVLGPPVDAERDLRGLILLRPRREAREIESPDRLACLRVDRDAEGERNQLGLVSRLNVVGTLPS